MTMPYNLKAKLLKMCANESSHLMKQRKMSSLTQILHTFFTFFNYVGKTEEWINNQINKQTLFNMIK